MTLLSRMQVVGVNSEQGLTRDVVLRFELLLRRRDSKPLGPDILPHETQRWSEIKQTRLSGKGARASTLLRQVHRTRQMLTLEKPTRHGNYAFK